MNPFVSFCLYVAARVFTQYLKARPTDHSITASLQFLMQAMNVIKRRNPLTESFLVQLNLDIEASGVHVPMFEKSNSYSSDAIVSNDIQPCSCFLQRGRTFFYPCLTDSIFFSRVKSHATPILCRACPSTKSETRSGSFPLHLVTKVLLSIPRPRPILCLQDHRSTWPGMLNSALTRAILTHSPHRTGSPGLTHPEWTCRTARNHKSLR